MNVAQLTFLAITFAISTGFSDVRAEIAIGVAGPLSGPYAWSGEQYRIGANDAIDKINADGGVLGQRVRLITGDDAADPEQAVAVARKFIADDVKFVVGHWSSGTSIPASKIYDEAGILMMSASSTNTKLTDEGGPGIFRICGRDDRQGEVVGEYLANAWADKKIAFIHDGSAYGKGFAEETRSHLNQRGVTENLFVAITPGEVDYSPIVEQMQKAKIDVVFFGGYPAEVGLIVREARDRNYDVQFVSGDSLSTVDFWLITGEAGKGTRFTFFPDARFDPANAELVAQFRARGIEPDGYTLYSYAVVQTWAQAIEKAGSLDLDAAIASLRENEFDTVLGKIAFNKNGDIKSTGFSWYIWESGEYVPVQ